ncbi:unnamed protein product [Dovyalis caffra]|uniref:Uncharacterized protein n=1 Tax=Dovyalis caffra TaxID=77055 RepID=A0AAV1S201_9ROSI|nr:unnamed protein product [Dovyalis caffra]
MEEEKKKRLAFPVVLMMLLMFSLMISPALASCSSGGHGSKGSGGTKKPPGGSGCKDCVLDQMKYSCPNCVPILHCVARCLWGGSLIPKCTKRCDCDGGKPTLSDCKKCMSRCKCSCVATA